LGKKSLFKSKAFTFQKNKRNKEVKMNRSLRSFQH